MFMRFGNFVITRAHTGFVTARTTVVKAVLVIYKINNSNSTCDITNTDVIDFIRLEAPIFRSKLMEWLFLREHLLC